MKEKKNERGVGKEEKDKKGGNVYGQNETVRWSSKHTNGRESCLINTVVISVRQKISDCLTRF